MGDSGDPDETTICEFHHLLEKQDLGKRLFAEVNRYLADCGITISGARLLTRPSSTRPARPRIKMAKRDPEMHQTMKGNQWFFGMKAHIGADSRTKLVHSIVATAANVHDSKVIAGLLHGSETRVYGDSAYIRKGKVIREKSPLTRAFINKRAHRNRPSSDQGRATNRRKSSICSRAEHVFGTIKGTSDSRKCAIAGWQRMRTASTSSSRYQICSWSRKNCCAFQRRSCLSKYRKVRPLAPDQRGKSTNGSEGHPKMPILPCFPDPSVNRSDLP